mgnify:CR=1 FL=1
MRSLLNDLDAHERYNPPSPEDNVFDQKPPKRESDYYCLARRKWKPPSPFAGKWGYCYKRAGAGTNHKGYGRCHLHGGATPHAEMRYAAMTNPSIAEKIAKHLSDPNPLNLRPELAAARALFEHFLEEYEANVAAIRAWHASFDKKRRGLHDHPLYNILAVKEAIKALGERAPDADMDELHAALEMGVERVREERMKQGKGELVDDLKVEKPVKVKDISYGVTILKVVSDLTDAIIKHEREAFLSVFAVETLIQTYAKETRKQLVRHLKRMGVTDDEAVERILADVSKAWERAPVVETSVPRLAAEQRQRDKWAELN